jgi:DNA-binding NarL/FixJ family response regulator
MKLLSPRRRHDVDDDPIIAQFRDYQPPAGMLCRDLTLVKREGKILKAHAAGCSNATIAARLKIPVAIVAATLAGFEPQVPVRARRGS